MWVPYVGGKYPAHVVHVRMPLVRDPRSSVKRGPIYVKVSHRGSRRYFFCVFHVLRRVTTPKAVYLTGHE